MSSGGGNPGLGSIDRRTMLQTTGMAASAGILGLNLGSVTAASDSEHYLIVSDLHLGSPLAFDGELRQFLSTDVPDIGPDELVLAGDTFEFWWRGETSAVLEHSDVVQQIQSLDTAGIDVTLVAGNHDRRLVGVGIDDWEGASPGPPWQIGEAYFFESGDEEFVVRHGDGPDPLQFDWLSTSFCKAGDRFGKSLFELVTGINDVIGANTIGETGTVQITETLGSEGWQTVEFTGDYDDPVVFTSPVSYGSEKPVHARVNYEGSTWFNAGDSFDIRLERRDDPTADHPTEVVAYVALEQGTHVFDDGTTVEVGRTAVSDSSEAVSFEHEFDRHPKVFTAVQTAETDGWWFSSPAEAVVSGVTSVSSTGFRVTLESVDGDDPVEQDVGYLAMEDRRSIVNAGGIESETAASSEWFTLPIRTDSSGSVPPFLVSRQSNTADVPAGLRYRTSAGSAIDVLVDGDASDALLGYASFGNFDSLALASSTAVDLSERTEDDLVAAQLGVLLDELDVETVDALPDELQTHGVSTNSNRFGERIRDTLLDWYPGQFVIYGHTHVPDLGHRWANCGCWTDRGGLPELPKRTFVEVLDGDVTVWNWTPQGREVLFE